MNLPAERLQAFEAQLARVLARLEALEQRLVPAAVEQAAPMQAQSLGFADQLQQRLSTIDHLATPAEGIVAYAGAVRSPSGELVWDFERSATDLLALEPEPVAQVLATLGHAVRLQLLQVLLPGSQNSQQLQEVLGLTSSGPLYYHLKELIAVGLVTQPSRNLYQVNPQRVVPLLVILPAALDVRGG